jgi:hypothetical protein
MADLCQQIGKLALLPFKFRPFFSFMDIHIIRRKVCGDYTLYSPHTATTIRRMMCGE